ncbi:MAG: hypothetical protein AAGA90_04095 [Actinomycetota bacterium]
MARPYANRQIGWWFVVPLLVVIPFAVVILVLAEVWWLGVVVGLVLATVYGTFATLTTTVERGEVRIGFTAGWPRRVIPVSAITDHRAVRNRWWYGWGIRKIPGGWLYSVWGLDAVEIQYRDAKRGKDRMFRAGTNDPDGLDAALTAARANRS